MADGLVEFRSFAGGDSSTQALTASRTYADLRRYSHPAQFACDVALHLKLYSLGVSDVVVGDRQLSSRETPSGGMNKNAFVEITKLYFYEEVVDLLPIKMVRPTPLDSALPLTPHP
jgi:hypothetical protein